MSNTPGARVTDPFLIGGTTGVGWHFSASHRDLVRNELHGHSYEVVAWWPADPPRDAMVLQTMLRALGKPR